MGHRNSLEAAEGTYLTDHLTDEAIRLISERDSSKPYFLHLAHYTVHTPLQAPAVNRKIPEKGHQHGPW